MIIFISVSDPIVLLERLNPKIPFNFSEESHQEKSVFSAEVNTLTRKGNENLKSSDPHTCCVCQKVISNRSHLKMHLETAHCKSTKITCDLCSIFFFNKRMFDRHVKFVHGDKKHSCNVCDFKTASKYILKVHNLTHAAKVECLTCNKPVSSLKKHMRSHVPKESCLICQKLLTKFNMKRHKKEIHKIG